MHRDDRLQSIDRGVTLNLWGIILNLWAIGGLAAILVFCGFKLASIDRNIARIADALPVQAVGSPDGGR